MNLAGAEQPVLDRLQGIHLDEIGMFEQTGDTELVLGLLDELGVAGTADRHHLEGVVGRVLAAADVENGAVRTRAQRAEDLKFADVHAPTRAVELDEAKINACPS